MKKSKPSPDQSSGAREESLFEEALQYVDSQERAEFLLRACPNDQDLRRQVESLVRAHFQANTFLDGQAVEPERPAIQTELITVPVVEQPGQRIGPYKLLQQIGEGGCGVVFMAEQVEPVKRRVALKVIKLGMDTRRVVARFEAERQALAMMDHPNIARVLDAGGTESGRPYFVMELVRGLPITRYADEHNLSTGERLQLFIQVCRAVQHAHQKGIIHRDLKPSNVLVTLHDGVPVPKVIDFGIAKATNQQQLTDKTLFTAFEQFIGTPAYMSPEQTELSGLDIDTRSDIYSLGVLLYELLTGHTPFDAKQLLESGFEEMRRTIREREPAKPSTCLVSLLESELTTVARTRRTEAAKLVSRVRGDLDWVVMKCLEKDRLRRYETAGTLAEDVQRHLSSTPIQARPPSVPYRARKFIRRNRVPVASGSVVALLLIVALTTHFIGYLRLKEARAAAVAAAAEEAKWRQQAEREAALAKLTLLSHGAEADRMVAPTIVGRMREMYFQRRLEYWTNSLLKARSMLNEFADVDEIRMMALQVMGAHARAQFHAGQMDAARKGAEEWLSENTRSKSWYYGNVIHNANALLGRIALSHQSLDQASHYLLKAGASPGSPQLNSFGPDFTFARELLETGKTNAVLQYLDRVATFWGHRYNPGAANNSSDSTNAERLERWKEQIQAGQSPNDPKWLISSALP